MADGSGIQWTEATWNPVTGCTRVSAGCDNCYAVKESYRLERMGQARYAGLTVLNGRGKRHFNGTVRCHDDALTKPLRWRKPRRVFVNSMSDLFHPGVPFEFVDKVFAVMALCPQHTFQILTKRPERMAEYLGAAHGCARAERRMWIRENVWSLGAVIGASDRAIRQADEADDEAPLPNVWLGASCEDQPAADKRVSYLMQCPAAVRFLSCEPLVGPLDLTAVHPPACDLLDCLRGGWRSDAVKNGRIYEKAASRIDWVIVGGESGPDARPCDVEWIRSVVRQCRSAGVACFVKQLGRRVIDRNDAGFDADEHQVLDEATGQWRPYSREAWPSTVDVEHDIKGYREVYQGAPVRVHLRDHKGGDPSEWPKDLRVREFPRLPGAGAAGNGADGAHRTDGVASGGAAC